MLTKEVNGRPSDADLIDKLRAVAGGAPGDRKASEPFDRPLPVMPKWSSSPNMDHGAAPPAAPRSHAGRWILVATIVAVALGGVWLWDALRNDGEPGPNRGAALEQPRDATNGGGDGSSGPQYSGPSSSSGGTEGETGAAETAPAIWATYADPETGYALAYPSGWTVRAQSASDTTTDFVDPKTGTYLRVDWTDEPGPSPESLGTAIGRLCSDP